MVLVERQIIKKTDVNWKQIDHMSFIAKNLYNQAIYFLKNHYQKTGKHMRYFDLDKYFRDNLRENYDLLPNNTSQLVLKLIDQNYRSFFKLMQVWKKNNNILNGLPKPPKYKHKTKGRCVLEFTKQQYKLKNGVIHFPKKMNMKPIKTKIEKIIKVRIVPQSDCYVLEVIYLKEENDLIRDEIKDCLSIDLGVNNLCSIVSNKSGVKPLLINGKPLKTMGQYFNKKLANMQSQLMKNHKKYSSRKIQSLYSKHKLKISNYLHHVSKQVIKYAIDNEIDTIIIGLNKGWKQNINTGKKNNQKFVQIPFDKLIGQIKYKAKLNGIKVCTIEESYTSKVDHFALEEMTHQEEYKGKRVKRGLFQSSTGIRLNADINGAIGILRKVIGNDFLNLLDRGCIAQPVKIKSLQNHQMRCTG